MYICTIGKKVDEIANLPDEWDPMNWIFKTNKLKCEGVEFRSYIKQVKSGQIEPTFQLGKDEQKSSEIKKLAKNKTKNIIKKLKSKEKTR